MSDWSQIERHISECTGRPFQARHRNSVGGGCINAAHVLSDGQRQFFVKLNEAHLADMFEAEAEGLEEILASRSLRAPVPVCHGIAGSQAYLVMEHLALGGNGEAARLGRGLAQMHRRSRDRFGWHRDNTIGSTPQPNGEDSDWARFWQRRRLGHQLELAARNGGTHLLDKGERLLQHVPDFFTDYRPAPSLLHGDLWGGNQAWTPDGEPVIFDPAVYYGDRETDLAMTELFGGFPRAFYAAYDEAWPIDPGYRVRKTLYNLYHILNHFNLFGGGYLGQAQRMIEQLLSEVR